MQEKLKCFSLLPLKEIALRRLIIFFLSDYDLVTSIPESRFQFCVLIKENKKELRENIEDKIKPKMLKLDLPKTLTRQMINLIRPITLEINRWKKFHQDYLDEGLFVSSEEISISDSSKLCWTTAGKIDNKKTAEKLVLSNELVLRDRYELACLYCLEDQIPLLWEKLPEEQKEYFCVDGDVMPDLHCCWPHVLKGELSKLDHLLTALDRNLTSFNQWAFEDSVARGNKSAAEYFFNKLTREEKDASLMHSAHALASDFEGIFNLAERFTDTLCYVFSLMTLEQQMETIKAYPVNILLCFLYWPWQDLFLDNAGLIWSYLPPSCYDDLIQKMTDVFRIYSPKSFPEFFLQSPLHFRKYFVEPKFRFIPACLFLSFFFRSEDTESVEVMFRNVAASDRVRIVFHPDALELFRKSILRDRWHMMKVCLREARLSKADRETLRLLLWEFFERNRHFAYIYQELEGFFESLDETDASADYSSFI